MAFLPRYLNLVMLYAPHDALKITARATITAVSVNELTLSSRSTRNIATPATVSKITSLNGESNILGNIYDSILSNIGNLTHEQVEDGLSNFSDGRPYKFNDTYLSNLLQLTQAIRYVYPTINSEFKNDLFYDFRYSLNPADPYYIGNFIDLVTSEVFSQKFYDSLFIGKGAKSINDILIGYGTFAGVIVVATDIGIFWARLENNFEANWFYINELPFAVYDLMIFGGEKLLVASANGTYYSTDMETWTLESAPAILYPFLLNS